VTLREDWRWWSGSRSIRSSRPTPRCSAAAPTPSAPRRTRRLPGLFGAARFAARTERARGRAGDGDRYGPAQHDLAVDVSPQELLSIRHAQGLSDQSVRRCRSTPAVTSTCPTAHGCSIERAHLEEDTPASRPTWEGSGRIRTGPMRSLVDYNRLRRAPGRDRLGTRDIRSSPRPARTAAELRGILIATGASDGRMEEGSMRIDATFRCAISVTRSARDARSRT